MVRIKSVIFPVLVFVMLAVLPIASAAAQQSDPLAGTTWQLASIGGRNIVAPPDSENAPSVTFGSDGSVSGYGGCNTFGGAYSVSGDTLTVSRLVSTRRACVDETIMQQEQALLGALSSATTFRVEDEQLVLQYGRGESLVLTSALSLVGSAWVLVSYGEADDPTPAVPDAVTTLSFDETRAGGSGGCNNYGGSYVVGSGDSIRFSEVASTMMACLEAGIMEQEGAYLEALNAATGYRLTNDQLVITYGEGEQLTFSRIFQLAGSAWQLVSYGAAEDPTPVAAGSAITLELDENNVASGSGGCNSYRSGAGVVQPDGSLSFGAVVSSRMACEGLMEQESAYFAALQSATDYTIVDGQLIITYGSGEQLVFAPLLRR